jgi:hypothetical protein
LVVVIADGTEVSRYSIIFDHEVPRATRTDEYSAAVAVRLFVSPTFFLDANGFVSDGRRRRMARVGHLAFDQGYFAAVNDDSSLRLVGPCLSFTVPFYGDTISCCALSSNFKIAVCGTLTRRLVLISLFDGAKVNVLRLDDRPEMLLITPAWGFIIVYAIAEGERHALLIYDINGRLIRKAPLPCAVRQWAVWQSRDGFDFLLIVARDCRVFVVEAFWGDIGEPIDRAYWPVLACAYCESASVIALLSEDGQLVFLPATETGIPRA